MNLNPRVAVLVAGLALLLLGTSLFAADEQPSIGQTAAVSEGMEFFENEIRPLLIANCYACHGKEKSQGGLRLTSREALLQGGDTGPAIMPGKPDESLLIRAVGYAGDLKMPPKQKLTDPEIAKLKRWVVLGAPWPSGGEIAARNAGFEITPSQRAWWSLQPLADVQPPVVKDTASIRNDIDRFIIVRLEEQGVRPSPAADPLVLLRRVTYDLTGLPPTPAEIEAFQADISADRISHAVERLLDSPQYGVHWARHWLDVARYGDTRWVGAGEDKRWPFAYTYRDWVVNALNADLPYDRFVTLQLAADQMPDAAAADQAALGFLTVGRWFTGVMPDVIDDQIDVVTRGLMGLTMQCTRCHDHKYDPLSTSDYYSLYGLFAASRMPSDGFGILASLPEVAPRPVAAETLRELSELQNRLDAFLQDRLAAVRAEYRPIETMRRYLRVATTLIGKNDDDVRAAAAAHRLHRSILFRWFRLLQRTSQNSHPVFGPYHALAALPPAEFEARAATIVATEIANPKLNPQVAKILVPTPNSMDEVIDRYLELLMQFNTPEKFNKYEDDSLRDILANSESPILTPLRELGEHFAPDELQTMVDLRRAVLARQARLSEQADHYLIYDREAARLTADVTGFIEKRQAELSAELRSAKKIADGLLAVRDAAGADDSRLKSIIKARGLSDRLLNRWIDYLHRDAQQPDSVFAAWRNLAEIPEDEFADRATAVLAERNEQPVNRLVAAAFATKPATLAEAAQRYGDLLVRHQQVSPAADADERQLHQVWIASDSPLVFTPDDVFDSFTRRDMDEVRNRERNLARVYLESPGAPPRAMALQETSRGYEQRIFRRGNPNDHGAPAHGGFPTVLQQDGATEFQHGRGRLELAQQIIDPANPLTARVIVNRVWQWHFGTGLVRTSSDFGQRGSSPSHPELLDWLTQQFLADGWSLKKLHRRILNSATWQQSSRDIAENHACDPENRLLWRMNRRRLTFEEFRDSMLAVSGRLETSLGGRPTDLTIPSVSRRTLYGSVDRMTLPGFYRSFDFPSPDAHVAERFETIVPQQALYLMNNSFTMDRARELAHRTADSTASGDRITQLYRLSFGRHPDADEIALSMQFVQAGLAEQATASDPAVQPPPEKKSNAWQYGYGAYREDLGRVVRFEHFPYFNGQWRGGPQDNDPVLGRCSLNSNGGTAGRDGTVAAIRRWVAPRSGVVSIAGNLSVQPNSTEPAGDGVRGRIVSSRHGLLGVWLVHGTEETTDVNDLQVQQGDAIDFLADGRGRDQSAGFQWAPVLTMTADGTDPQAPLKWEANKDFQGAAPPVPMYDLWAQFAQVLLESNEFLMLD